MNQEQTQQNPLYSGAQAQKVQQKQQKFCMQCNQIQSAQNRLRSPLGPGWDICNKCMEKNAKIMFQFRKNRPNTYPQIQMIEQGLYLGNEDAANDKDIIQKYHIRAICACGSYLQTSFEGKKMEGKFQNIAYKKHSIADAQDEKIKHLFDQTCDWIEQNLAEGRNVLVHCAAGVSRSASFIIAFLMNKRGMLYPDAHRYAKQKRSRVYPNSGFRNQLQQYGKDIIYKTYGVKMMEQKQQKQQNNKKQLQ